VVFLSAWKNGSGTYSYMVCVALVLHWPVVLMLVAPCDTKRFNLSELNLEFTTFKLKALHPIWVAVMPQYQNFTHFPEAMPLF